MAPGRRLTPHEVAGTVAAREEWRRAALSTEPCDRPAAEDAVRRAYRAAGLDPPVVVWMESPVGAALAMLAVRLRVFAPKDLDELPDQLGGSAIGRWLLARLDDRLVGPLVELARRRGGGLEEIVHDRFWSTCVDRLLPAWPETAQGDEHLLRVWFQVCTVLGEPPSGQDDAGLWEPPWGEPWDAARIQLTRRYIAVGDPPALHAGLAHRVVVSRRVFEIAGRAFPPLLTAVSDILRAVGRWWPMHGVSVLSERPTELHVDRNGRVHRDGGPAVVHADGVAVHAWHGVRVPEDLVTGEGWPVARVLAERNAELHRCAVERLGWDRFVSAAGLTQVGPDRPDPGNPGQVLRLFELPRQLRAMYAAKARILVVSNASRDRDGGRRVCGLPVPATVDDPVVAAALTFAVDPAEYAALARAT